MSVPEERPDGRPDDRFSESFPDAVGDFQPVTIPDLRKPRPLRQRLLRWAVILGLLGVLAGVIFGGSRWAQRREVERTIREQYQQQTKTAITSLSLSHQGDGKYTGTLVTAGGDELDVTAEVTTRNRNRWISWVAQVPLEKKRGQVREDFERNNQPVKSVELKLDEKGRYVGKVVLQSGDEFEVRESEVKAGNFQTHYEYSLSTVEKWVHAQAGLMHNDKLTSVTVHRIAPDTYAGTANGASGVTYQVTVEPNPEKKETIRTHLKPTPDHVGRWLKHQLETTNDVKVKDIAVKPRPGGDYAGEAVVEGGVVWDVRAGTPPAWAGTARAGMFTWQATLAPASYEGWVKDNLGAARKCTITSVKLKPKGNGEYEGIARGDDGLRYQVRVWRDKPNAPDGEEADWPDLGGKLKWEAVRLD